MSETGRLPRVGVRELRQNLSVYLRRVKGGETLEVTEHGHPVARLTPPAEAVQSPYQRMVAEGRIRPATRDLMELLPAPPAPPGRSLSEILVEMREEERW